MDSKTEIKQSVTVRSIRSEISDICTRLLLAMEDMDYNKADIFAVHLSFEEAFANSIKHGNKMDPDKLVKVDYTVTQQQVELTITDEGNGFDPNSVPDPRCGENVYKSSGRGVLLIKSYMDDVKFNELGNSVCMVKNKTK